MTSEKYLKEVTVGPVSALSGKVVLEEYDAAWKGARTYLVAALSALSSLVYYLGFRQNE